MIRLWNYKDLVDNLSNKWQYIFITNNICESFNRLLNKYLNEGKTSIDSFMRSILSVIKLYAKKMDKIIRKDSRSRLLINIAENIGFNEILNFETFKKLETLFNMSINKNINFILLEDYDNELNVKLDEEYKIIKVNYTFDNRYNHSNLEEKKEKFESSEDKEFSDEASENENNDDISNSSENDKKK